MKLELEVKLKLELINVKQNMFISTYIEVIYSFLQRTLLENVGIPTFSGPYFTVMGLNTEIYSKSAYSVQMRDNTHQKTPSMDTFRAV